MKFTLAVACFLGCTEAITLWTTNGKIAYMENDDVEAENV